MRNFVLGVKTDAAIERAKAMAAAGQRTQAVSALRQLGGLKTLPAARRAAIASALYDLGDGAGASQFAQAAMSGDIADLEGYDAVVRVLAKTGRDDLARAALQRASSLATPRPKASARLRAWPPGFRSTRPTACALPASSPRLSTCCARPGARRPTISK
jgi:Flp pilus assembly protein TadD